MSDEAIEAGDLVAVMDDKEIVQMMQEDCGGWNAEMAVVSYGNTFLNKK